MSHAYSPYGTAAALKAAERIIGPDRVWNGINDVQRGWLDHYARLAPESATIKEIAANATFDPQDHVDFLKKHGWEAQIKTCGPDEFLTAAVLDVLGRWHKRGTRAEIEHGGRSYSAASLTNTHDEVRVRKGTNERYVTLTTKEGDRIYMEMMPSAPEGLALVTEAADRFKEDRDDYDGEFDGLVFPMISLAGKSDLAWLKELWTLATTGQRCKVVEAKQQVELKASHLGIRARSADEMRLALESCITSCNPPYFITEPFLLAITRPGLSLPLFAAHVTPDAWKDPGDFGA